MITSRLEWQDGNIIISWIVVAIKKLGLLRLWEKTKDLTQAKDPPFKISDKGLEREQKDQKYSKYPSEKERKEEEKEEEEGDSWSFQVDFLGVLKV